MKEKIKVAVNAVIFGYAPARGLSVFLVKSKDDHYRNIWELPGRFVDMDESFEDALKQELVAQGTTSVDYLEQLYTFADPMRYPYGRVISIAYLGFVRSKDFQRAEQAGAEDVAWFNIKNLPWFAFDHRKIVDVAINRLKEKLPREPVAFELLDREFRFSDLVKLYQAVVDPEIDQMNFRKRLITLGTVVELDQTVGGIGRPAHLYRFNRKKYDELKENGRRPNTFL